MAGWKQSIIAFKGQVGTGCEMQGCDAIIHLLFKKDVIEAILEFLKDVIAISFEVKFKLSEEYLKKCYYTLELGIMKFDYKELQPNSTIC